MFNVRFWIVVMFVAANPVVVSFPILSPSLPNHLKTTDPYHRSSNLRLFQTRGCPNFAPNVDNCDGNDDIVVGDRQRRNLFSFAVKSSITFACLAAFMTAQPKAAHAGEVRAPLPLLRPATRVRLYIDEAVSLCESILSSSSSSSSTSSSIIRDGLEQLQQLFLNEPTTFILRPDEVKLSHLYLDIDTTTPWEEARRKEREARGAALGIDYTTPYDKVNTRIQAWGATRQFEILSKRQRALEQRNPIRAALNAYTNNLVYSDAYQLNLQGDARKELVRSDALPDVNAVVVSDLDLRDLYRNQILQNWDDVQAEVAYQLKSEDWNIAEVLTLLKETQSSCRKWFSFIPQQDVEDALAEVLVEKETEKQSTSN